MAEITDADRAQANRVWQRATLSDWADPIEVIAQALATQRAELEAGFDAAYEGLRAGQTTEWAIELHYLEGDDGWRAWTNSTWQLGKPLIYTDRAAADQALEGLRRGYGNGGRDWARLVTRTVSAWEQVPE